MTTTPVHSITDEQIAELENHCQKFHGFAITSQMVMQMITRLREAEKDTARYKSALIEIADEIDGNIRPTVRDCVNGRPDVQDIYDYCDCIDKTIYAAMQGEQ